MGRGAAICAHLARMGVLALPAPAVGGAAFLTGISAWRWGESEGKPNENIEGHGNAIRDIQHDVKKCRAD